MESLRERDASGEMINSGDDYVTTKNVKSVVLRSVVLDRVDLNVYIGIHDQAAFCVISSG